MRTGATTNRSCWRAGWAALQRRAVGEGAAAAGHADRAARRPGHADRHGRRRRLVDGRRRQPRRARLRLGAARQRRDRAPRAGGARPLLAARRRQPDPLDPRRRRGRPVERDSRDRARGRAAARASTCARSRPRTAACRRARSGATKRRSGTSSPYRPQDLSRFKAICDRERCSVRRSRHRDRGRQADRRGPEARRPAGRHRPRRDPRQAAEDAAGCQAREDRESSACPWRRSPWRAPSPASCAIPRWRTRPSWSPSATAPSAGCARATPSSALGRCRSPTAR